MGWGLPGGRGMLGGGGQRRKNWDNCNSIINKIQLLLFFVFSFFYIILKIKKNVEFNSKMFSG